MFGKAESSFLFSAIDALGIKTAVRLERNLGEKVK
jgi:hypothetical protein